MLGEVLLEQVCYAWLCVPGFPFVRRILTPVDGDEQLLRAHSGLLGFEHRYLSDRDAPLATIAGPIEQGVALDAAGRDPDVEARQRGIEHLVIVAGGRKIGNGALAELGRLVRFSGHWPLCSRKQYGSKRARLPAC